MFSSKRFLLQANLYHIFGLLFISLLHLKTIFAVSGAFGTWFWEFPCTLSSGASQWQLRAATDFETFATTRCKLKERKFKSLNKYILSNFFFLGTKVIKYLFYPPVLIIEGDFSQYFTDFWLTLWPCIPLTGPHPPKWKEQQLTNLQSSHSKFCVVRCWNVTQIFSTIVCSKIMQHQWKVILVNLDSRLVRVRCTIEGGQDWNHCISVEGPDNAETFSVCSVIAVFTRNCSATSFHVRQLVWNR